MTTTILPISKPTYAARLGRLKEQKPLQAICNKCGMLSISFYAGRCWLCCHADNPTFGTSNFRKCELASSERMAEARSKLEQWIGREVEFQPNDSPNSPSERGTVMQVTQGLKNGLRFRIQSSVTGKQCYRQPDQVRLAKQTEAADVLQPTA